MLADAGILLSDAEVFEDVSETARDVLSENGIDMNNLFAENQNYQKNLGLFKTRFNFSNTNCS